MKHGTEFEDAESWQDSCPACGTTVPLSEATTAAELSGYRCGLCERLLILLRVPDGPLRIFDTTHMSADTRRITSALQRGSAARDLDSLEIVELIMELDDRSRKS